jgi:hypothetical protein
MVVILAAFAPLFSHGVWTKAQALAVGALLATGPRTVCAILRILGKGQECHFINYHRSGTATLGPAWPPARSSWA